jgi:hypothetical protein
MKSMIFLPQELLEFPMDSFLPRSQLLPGTGSENATIQYTLQRCVALPIDGHNWVSEVASLVHTPMVTTPFHPTFFDISHIVAGRTNYLSNQSKTSDSWSPTGEVCWESFYAKQKFSSA